MLFDGFGYIDTDPRLPSYLPVISSPFTSSMSFSERVVNFHMKFISEHVFVPLTGFMEPFRELRRKHGYNTSLTLDDTFKRASLRFRSRRLALLDYTC